MLINCGAAVAIMRDTVTAYEAKREKYLKLAAKSRQRRMGGR